MDETIFKLTERILAAHQVLTSSICEKLKGDHLPMIVTAIANRQAAYLEASLSNCKLGFPFVSNILGRSIFEGLVACGFVCAENWNLGGTLNPSREDRALAYSVAAQLEIERKTRLNPHEPQFQSLLNEFRDVHFKEVELDEFLSKISPSFVQRLKDYRVSSNYGGMKSVWDLAKKVDSELKIDNVENDQLQQWYKTVYCMQSHYVHANDVGDFVDWPQRHSPDLYSLMISVKLYIATWGFIGHCFGLSQNADLLFVQLSVEVAQADSLFSTKS